MLVRIGPDFTGILAMRNLVRKVWVQKTSGNRAFSSPRHEFGGARKYKLIGSDCP